jgi:hypothetical protein
MMRDVFNNTYRDRWIGRRGTTAWPARSPDLNVLDYCYNSPVDNEETLRIAL